MSLRASNRAADNKSVTPIPKESQDDLRKNDVRWGNKDLELIKLNQNVYFEKTCTGTETLNSSCESEENN